MMSSVLKLVLMKRVGFRETRSHSKDIYFSSVLVPVPVISSSWCRSHIQVSFNLLLCPVILLVSGLSLEETNGNRRVTMRR
jgi:hypothetical protein